jgi:hypothetical protein
VTDQKADPWSRLFPGLKYPAGGLLLDPLQSLERNRKILSRDIFRDSSGRDAIPVDVVIFL